MQKKLASFIGMFLCAAVTGCGVEAADQDVQPEAPHLSGTMGDDSRAPDATANGGVVELRAGSSDTSVVVNVGGGTWNYGRSGDHCWSHYVHPRKYHSATAIKGSTNRKVYAVANRWANADINGGSGTCNAYWNTYD